MARIDDRHWQADTGQNWAQLAAAIGCTRNDLLAANGLPSANPPALTPGRILHVPF